MILTPEQRPVFTGLANTIYSISSAIGPILGGLFAERATWRWCFYINLPFGGSSAIIIFIFLQSPKTLRPKQQAPLKDKLSNLDPAGTILALGALLTFVRALQVAGIETPWKSGQVIGLLAASGAMTILFISVEYVLDDRAVLVKHLLRRRIILVSMLWACCHEAAFCTLLYALPIYFQAASGVSPAAAGIRNIPLLLACAIASLLTGWSIKRWRYHVPLMVFASAGGAVGTGLIYTLQASSPPSKWIGYQVLAGLTYGAGLPLGIISGQAGCSAEDIPATTAMMLCKYTLLDHSSISKPTLFFPSSQFQRRYRARPDGGSICAGQPSTRQLEVLGSFPRSSCRDSSRRYGDPLPIRVGPRVGDCASLP